MSIYKNAKWLISLARQRRVIILALAATWIVTWSLSLWAGTNETIPYPAGYRQWAHVKSALIGPESPFFESFGGLHHIYANEKAMEGYRTGRFPDGSVIVFDLLETRENAGVTIEGPRLRIGVMVKGSKRYAETGGWGYEGFRGDSQTDRSLTAESRMGCYNCHAQRKDYDFVFSTFRK
ncbi:MAG: cytochrome P460 family protein [Acidobacteria bacterium]|nr:cytochrome P460 family protein [Acidobacteriota bacterium]